ncbi:hypothetical protein HALLA_02235 (plasmid) [Halostagnicola larsenii XH-48]|uniref:Domain of unknown function domain-containing protein n=1 Tax=Halostagnicola larsenii XH-48 TaxID=797299 RepID=W0JVB4_9EURY|nr:hypothetical protein HALLA_02235 [Halostagnicola larsenii XH-48]
MSQDVSQEEMPESLRTAADADRPRGILTPSDRDFLLGRKTDYTDHSKKQKRNRIRRRVRNAVLDFSILFEYLEERDRNTVFDPDDDERDAYTQGITDMLAFLHLGTMGYHTPFKDMLSEGVGKAEQRLAGSNYRMVNVEFNVDPVGQIDVDDVVEKLEDEEFAQLTDEELRAFVRLLTMSDDFSPDETREEIKDRVDEYTQQVNESAETREQKLEELTN